jgi:hypothetical protein
MKRLVFALLIGAAAHGLTDAPAPPDTQAGRYRRANEHRILREFVRLLSLPNVASDRENIRRNAEHISEMMRARGLAPRLLEAATATGRPTPPCCSRACWPR